MNETMRPVRENVHFAVGRPAAAVPGCFAKAYNARPPFAFSFQKMRTVSNTPSSGSRGTLLKGRWRQTTLKTGPEEAQYFHVRPPIGFI